MPDFWDRLISGHATKSSSLDAHLGGRAIGAAFEGVRELTEASKRARCLKLPVKCGTRVRFLRTLEASLATDNPPPDGDVGTVVQVKSAKRMLTSHEGRVFVRGGDGILRTIHASFLQKIAVGESRKVASLSGFSRISSSTLIHKSTQDLWSFEQDSKGGLQVARLFDDQGKPVKG